MNDVRTSLGTFLSRKQDPDGVLARIEDRIAEVTGAGRQPCLVTLMQSCCCHGLDR